MDVRPAATTNAHRVLALVCLVAFLFASVAASVHKHRFTQDAACVICHVTHRASVATVQSGLGKPDSSSSHELIAQTATSAILDPPDCIRIPRAPPV